MSRTLDSWRRDQRCRTTGSGGGPTRDWAWVDGADNRVSSRASDALALDGAVAGWPVPINGLASEPDFAPDGTVVVTAGTYDRPVTRIYAFDPTTRQLVATSGVIPVVSASIHMDSDCSTWPSSPLVAADGTVYLMDLGTIHAFDRVLQALSGWPMDVPGELVLPVAPGFDGLTCDWGVGPVAGPDGTLYLSLEPASKSRGGRLDAIAKDGKRPAGWPVKLSRAGSTFWDVAVGEDGTVHALAVEPEGSRKASATLCSIDPDSEVRYAVTLLEP
jgi:WD40 repeat protein